MGVVGGILFNSAYIDDKETCFVLPKLLVIIGGRAYNEIEGQSFWISWVHLISYSNFFKKCFVTLSSPGLPAHFVTFS